MGETRGRFFGIVTGTVERVVDTTGAGDAFAAGFLYGLSRGLSLEACGRFGNAEASCVVEGLGASYGISAPENVFDKLKKERI